MKRIYLFIYFFLYIGILATFESIGQDLFVQGRRSFVEKCDISVNLAIEDIEN